MYDFSRMQLEHNHRFENGKKKKTFWELNYIGKFQENTKIRFPDDSTMYDRIQDGKQSTKYKIQKKRLK